MASTHIQDFAKRIEKEEGNDIPMWRQVWVIPADARKDKKKNYGYTEYPAMTAEEMANSSRRNKSDTANIPGRGCKKKPYTITQQEGGDCAYPATSIYVKRIPDMFVIDLDEKEKCNDKNPLYMEMINSGCPYTITAKGYHFYCYIDGTPDFTQSLSVQKIIDPIDPSNDADTGLIGAMDFLGRKHPSAFNPIEANHHELVNGDAPFPHFQWEDFSKKYLNVAKMRGAQKKKRDNQTREQQREVVAVSGDTSNNSGISEDLFMEYLNRLDISEGSKRYKYQPWVDMGIICWNNFRGEDNGFTIWMTWAHKDKLFKKLPDGVANEHSYRDLALHKTKWDGFGESETPLTWKTLRKWANEDDPALNIYQEVFDARQYDGLCDYMNEFLAFNKDTSEIIFLDPTDHSEFARVKHKKIADTKPMFEKFLISVPDEDEEEGSKKKKKKLNPFNLWMKNIRRRDVCGVIFDPSPSAPRNYYNLYDGFDIDQRDVADWSVVEAEQECRGLLDHIYHIWCRGNDEHYRFIISWFAHILQKPHIKVGCLVCVKSKEGGGKGIVFDFMRNILGRRLYKQINDIQHITGQWNSCLEGRLLINGDEVVWGGDVVKGNTLKGLITENEITINEKFRPSYSINNTTAFCMSSNEERCMSSREGDRRSFGLELDNKWCGKQKSTEHRDYFRNISGTDNATQGTSRKKAEAFAKYLFEWDLTGFNPANAPITDFVSSQIMKNWHPVEKWWHRVLTNGAMDIKQSEKKETIQNYTEDGYSKQRRIPYDEDQLIWGNVSEKWGNGVKQVETEYKKYDVIKAVPYYYSDKKMERGVYGEGWMACHSPCLWTKWEEFCKTNGVDIKKVPIPYALHSAGYDWGHDNRTHRYLPHHHPNGLRPEGYFQNDDDEFDISCGFPEDACWHLPDGKAPKIPEDTNPEHLHLFRRNMHPEVQLDWNMDINDPYGSVCERMDKKVYTNDSHKENDMSEWGFFHSHMHYYRLGCEGVFEMVDSPTGGKGVWGDIVIKEGMEEKWQEYLAKWKDGITPMNFAEDLPWLVFKDAKGKPLIRTKKVDDVKVWIYNKDWIFEKFQQQVGIGYGGNNIDQNTFWSRICEMLGGKYEDKKGGLYYTQRLRDRGDRKQFIRYVGLDMARDRF